MRTGKRGSTDMKYYLAPMEGLTTYTFRTVWNTYYGGMDKYFTPFISNRRMNSRERNDILPEHNEGMHTVPQILTNRADEFLALAGQLADYGYTCVNLNLGCPSGTVVSRNRGAGFLSVPRELDRFLAEIFSKCPIRISVKTRIGMEAPEEWRLLLAIYENYPMEELIIHPRLQQEGYTGTPHMEAFAEAASRLTCPLCYNGDITSPASLMRLREHFPNLETVMLGRGILQNPALLSQIKCPTSCDAELSTLRAFHDTLLSRYREIMSGDTNTLYKMKDLWTFLGRSFSDADRHLKKIKKADSISDYKIAVGNLFRECEFHPPA